MLTIGERLLVLKAHSGLSLAEIARRGGYKGASSIQKLFRSSYAPDTLPNDVAEKLIRALVGAGDPPIKREEITGLVADSHEIEQIYSKLMHYEHVNSDKIYLFKTKKIDDFVETDKNNKIQLFVSLYNNGSYFPAPPHLRGKQLQAFYISTGSMWPRFEEGEIIFYERRQPATPGDDVIALIHSEENLDGAMIIGRLGMINDDEVHLHLLKPQETVILARKSIMEIVRIPTRSEMLDPAVNISG